MFEYDEVLSSTLGYFKNDELAADVWVKKYPLKDKCGKFLEKTPDDMHKRLAREFYRIEKKFGGSRALSEEYIYNRFKNFQEIVAQGSPSFGIGNPIPVSLSNCVVVASPEDTMSGIFDKAKDLANLYKARAGVGIDISTLRPDGTPVNNAAVTSSGAWSFADFFSYVTRMVGQSSRRGACMITMDIRHPDIEKFITMKHDLSKVTGANISVKISDEFMHAVAKDEDFILQFPVKSQTPMITKKVRASYIWSLIIDSATQTAEPGLLFWDTMLRYLPAQCYADVGFDHITTNPCGELILSAGDSCRLMSINLKHFVKNPFSKNSYFDFDEFKCVVSAAMRLCDDLVELEVEKLQQIIDKVDDVSEKVLWEGLLKACKKGRRTGLGTHALADMLACMSLKYDSDEAVALTDSVFRTLRDGAYWESVCLAKERGAFEVFSWEKEKDNAFIKQLPEDLKNEMAKFGRRGISLLTNAPTGTVSLLSQTSSGIEPVFRNSYVRRRKIMHNENSEISFTDDSGDSWKEYKVYHHNVKQYMDLFGVDESDLPDFFVTSDNIDWKKRLQVQCAIQKYIDHSVSNTVNLPSGTETSVVNDIYMNAWQMGLKGVTVYVDGSRNNVLISNNSSKFKYCVAPTRPEYLECNIHQVTVKGEKWTILVGLMDGRPYEVFGGLSNLIEISSKHLKGMLVKRKLYKSTSRYDLELDDGGIIKNIIKVFDNPNYQVHTRMISLLLRHGTRPNYIVEQLMKDPDNDLTSFSRVISRVLKKYVEDGTKVSSSDKVCPSCSQESMVYQEGCVICRSCGYSKC